MAATLKLVGFNRDEVRDAARASCQAARALGLLTREEFERVANTTVERMTPADLRLLARVARQVASVLDQESRARA